MRPLPTFPIIICIAFASAQAQQPSPAADQGARVARAVDQDVLSAHLQFLADDALEGRRPGTRGGKLAAHYIATQFQRMGLEPAGDKGTFFHRVPIITLTPSPALRVNGADSVPLTYRDDYVLWSMRNDTTVSARGELVFVGHGIVAPEYQWNDYQGVNVKDKIVVTLVNDPGLRDSTLFRGSILTYYGRWTYKIEEAQRQGASGILLVHTTESATYPWTTVQSSWTGRQVRIEKPPTSLLVAGWLHEQAAARVFQQAGKDLSALTTQAYQRGFRAVPLAITAEAGVRSTIERAETHNVLGRWSGRGQLAREVVLIGGHYDHFGIGAPVKGDSIYNGAEDNASGTAAVLTAAEAFQRSGIRPNRSIVFIGFAAEESGLLGSEALVARPPFRLQDVAAVLNMDGMNLYGLTSDIGALGTDQSSLGRAFEDAARLERLKVTTDPDDLKRGYFFRSDHFPLAKAGIPGLSLQSGVAFVGKPASYGKEKKDEYIAERYHQPSDELLPWFSYQGAVQQIRVILRTAVSVANARTQPVWDESSEFRAAGEKRRSGGQAVGRPGTGG
jgi:Zn-dependent M28 family amino/carboxypeptidase